MRETREHHVMEAVLKRATFDRAFRDALLTAPHEAIEKAFGIRIPPKYRLRFVERDPDVDALIVLPDFDANAGDGESDELSDEELEHVAGGREMSWADGGEGE